MNELPGENQLQGVVIYQSGAVSILVKKVADPSAVDLLKRTVYGTNGVQYQHSGQEQKINQLQNPLFFHLFHDNTLAGIYCLDERKINISAEVAVSGFYGRYLSVAGNYQGKGYGRLVKVEAVRYVENHLNTPCIFYAYIEEKNTRSLRISASEGFTSIATLKTFVFRRYSPKIDFRFTRLAGLEKTALITRLKHYYRNHVFTTFTKIGYQDNYFVLKENNEIIAGVQANPVCWNFSSMPGNVGWLMMHIFPLFSVTRRFFNPKQYQFVALEGIYFKEGYEDGFAVLLESVLAHFGYHSALLQIDINDPLNTLLTDPKAMGRLSGFQKNINTHVMVKTMPPEKAITIHEQPIYVSSFDFT